MTKNAATALLAARKAGKALADAARTAGMTPEQVRAAGEGVRSIRQAAHDSTPTRYDWAIVSCNPDNGESFGDDDQYWYWVIMHNTKTGERYHVACTAGEGVLTDGEWHAHYQGREAWTLAGARHLTLREWRIISAKAEGYLVSNADLPTIESADAEGYLSSDDICPEDITVTARTTNGDYLDFTGDDICDIGGTTYEIEGCRRYLTDDEISTITDAYNDALQAAIDDLQDKIDALERAKV